MNATSYTAIGAALFAAAAMLTVHAIQGGAFTQVSTYIGIVCGIALVAAALAIGKRRQARER